MIDKKFAVLPLRDVVIYPGMILPLFIGRDSSIKALQASLDEHKSVCLATQKTAQMKDEITDKDIYKVGVLCNVLQFLNLPDGTVKILVEAKSSVKISDVAFENSVMTASVEVIENIDDIKNSPEIKNLVETLGDSFLYYTKISKKVPNDIIENLRKNLELGVVIDNVLNYVDIDIKTQQEILELPITAQRLSRFIQIVEQQIATFKLDQKIQNRIKFQLDKNQKDFYLNEKMKAISKELGDDNEYDVYEEKLKTVKLSKEAEVKVKAEIAKLKKMPPMSAETTVIRNYLDWVFDLPWGRKSKLSHDISEAKKILDEDHYGLEKVKERIIQNLIVQKRTKKTAPTILCLFGPPGVGKTSLGQSIARAMGRKFDRISLGGVSDESTLRGHRRTYIGSQPGRIMATLKKVGTNNPLIMLDEIDKMTRDWHGDPTAVLLEILDPAQNKAFNDHYIELDYDLSDVMFITTANSLNIPRPLRDRMEIINIEGYTEDEKLQIAKNHLINKIFEANGVGHSEIVFDDNAILDLIRYYTQEAGVRNLDRAISKVVRKSIMEIEDKGLKNIKITRENLKEFAGIPQYSHEDKANKNQVGVVNGLAWTEVGGELLPLEAVYMYGKGNLTLTGSLGDVMKESIQTAKSFIKSRAISFGIHPQMFDKYDIHIHAPEGATPKDGPSAGLAFATVIVSLLTGIPVKSDVAMTGEINLQGKALAIGGLKQKLLAAKRAGIKTVLIPAKNVKDLEEVPDNIKNALEIKPVETADEVFEIALATPLIPLKWDKEAEDRYLNIKHDENMKPTVN